MSIRVTNRPGTAADLAPEAVQPAAPVPGARRAPSSGGTLRAGRRGWRFASPDAAGDAPSDTLDDAVSPALAPLTRAPRRPRRRGARGADVPGAEAEYEQADERQVRARAGRSQASLSVAVGGASGGRGGGGHEGSDDGARQQRTLAAVHAAESHAGTTASAPPVPAEIARRVDQVIDLFGVELRRHSGDPRGVRDALAHAVFALTRIERDHAGSTPLRHAAWRLMADHLGAAQPNRDAAPDTLREIRERLAALFADGTPAASDALRRFQLLAPLWLLNAARPRRERDARRAAARLRMMLADGDAV
ncbi:hypothetical protein CUJ89_35890 [Burkholderia pyrrocinia]|uniref:Uncharacterized protein n=1 Tax=Burkholderia pyrrocinia TaxID=60550 RepID=A0A2Z5NC12_BURPY|nr:hypothetical protein [Burkholderia pyrrocinia]AXF25797.1 hypothetical protein CUJ89_35890 [Burkholderia pyrrocinia]